MTMFRGKNRNIPWQNYNSWKVGDQRYLHRDSLPLYMEVLGTWATLHDDDQWFKEKITDVEGSW